MESIPRNEHIQNHQFHINSLCWWKTSSSDGKNIWLNVKKKLRQNIDFETKPNIVTDANDRKYYQNRNSWATIQLTFPKAFTHKMWIYVSRLKSEEQQFLKFRQQWEIENTIQARLNHFRFESLVKQYVRMRIVFCFCLKTMSWPDDFVGVDCKVWYIKVL